MGELKKSQITLIEKFVSYPCGIGYVQDFSDRTFSEWFEDEWRVNIDDKSYENRGTSKRHRLVCFCLKSDSALVVKVLRSLFDRTNIVKNYLDNPAPEDLKQQFLSLVVQIETTSDMPKTDAIYRWVQDRTLSELISDLERSLAADKPEVAIDHLHTYCVKKFRYLLSVRNVECDRDEPLHSIFGKYRKTINLEKPLDDFSDTALKVSISVLEKFNGIRNESSLAHDNELIRHAEARFVFDTVSALLRFVKSIEAGRFEEIRPVPLV